MKSLAMVLAIWLALGLVQLARAELPAGCVKTAKACDCYSPQGKRVELSRDVCEVVMAPAPVKLTGGDLDAMAVKAKSPDPERSLYVKAPITWLIER